MSVTLVLGEGVDDGTSLVRGVKDGVTVTVTGGLDETVFGKGKGDFVNLGAGCDEGDKLRVEVGVSVAMTDVVGEFGIFWTIHSVEASAPGAHRIEFVGVGEVQLAINQPVTIAGAPSLIIHFTSLGNSRFRCGRLGINILVCLAPEFSSLFNEVPRVFGIVL